MTSRYDTHVLVTSLVASILLGAVALLADSFWVVFSSAMVVSLVVPFVAATALGYEKGAP